MGRVSVRFLRNPSELKGIKNISLLRHLPPPSAYSTGADDAAVQQSHVAGRLEKQSEAEDVEEEDVPHDLSIPKSADRLSSHDVDSDVELRDSLAAKQSEWAFHLVRLKKCFNSQDYEPMIESL